MGNATSSDYQPSSRSRKGLGKHHTVAKQIRITTDHPDGFYFTDERLTGTVKIPTSFLHSQLRGSIHRATTETFNNRSLRNPIIIELVGDATYSSEQDAAADSDGHATHRVNLCRQSSVVTISQHKTETETVVASPSSTNTNFAHTLSSPVLYGTFQIHIPDGVPPSLANDSTPCVTYVLELKLSSSRYQIPIILAARGSIPYPMADAHLTDSAMNKNQVYLKAHLSKQLFRPAEHIVVQINYSNPQQRFIRSITVQLVQFYRIHTDLHRSILDGKEWSFDNQATTLQEHWAGEVTLQLPDQPLSAAYSTTTMGTRQKIDFTLDYRILIELDEKKGDGVRLTLAPIQVTYQK